MALPTGDFTAAIGGRLQVTFSGQWRKNSTDILGGGAWQLQLAGFVGSGAGRLVTILSFETNSAVIEVPYTANTTVPVGLEFVARSWGGAGTVSATQLRVVCRLFAAAA